MTIIINGKPIEIPGGSLSAGDVGVYSVTQAEYDAIPESDRAGNLYVITDAKEPSGGTGSSSGSSMEVYDGEERVIGTWFGKPLYQKTLTGTIPLGSGEFDVGTVADSIDIVVDILFTTKLSNGYWTSFPFISMSNTYALAQVLSTDNSLRVYMTDSILSGKPFYATITYTKEDA